jgi:hypothetical protein
MTFASRRFHRWFFMLLFVKFFNDNLCILWRRSDNLEIWKAFVFRWRIIITLTCILMNVSCIDEFFISSLSRLRVMLLCSLSCKCSIFHSDTLQDRCLCDRVSKIRWSFSINLFFVFEIFSRSTRFRLRWVFMPDSLLWVVSEISTYLKSTKEW